MVCALVYGGLQWFVLYRHIGDAGDTDSDTDRFRSRFVYILKVQLPAAAPASAHDTCEALASYSPGNLLMKVVIIILHYPIRLPSHWTHFSYKRAHVSAMNMENGGQISRKIRNS